MRIEPREEGRKRPKIFVCLHTQNERTGWVHPQLWDFAARAYKDAQAAGKEFGFASIACIIDRTHEYKPQSVARQQTVEKFLKTDCTHLLMMDNDTPPSYVGEDLNPFRMLRAMMPRLGDYDIVSAAVITYKKGEQPFTLYRKAPESGPHHLRTIAGEEIQNVNNDRNDGLIDLAAAGSGMMLIRRKVIEAMHPFCFVADPGHAWDVRFYAHYNASSWPEDIFFTRKACEQFNFRLAGDLRMVCSHYHTVDLLSMALARGGLQAKAVQKG